MVFEVIWFRNETTYIENELESISDGPMTTQYEPPNTEN